jgi:hypothetical protein
MYDFRNNQIVLEVNSKHSLFAVDEPLSVVFNRILFLEGRGVDVNLVLLLLVHGHKLIVSKHKIK